LLLLEDGHCLRDQALDVCRTAGAGENGGFRATSLETLRQMVAANVGVTLLPSLAVKPPVAQSDAIRLLPFRDPQPSRRIAMVWRRSSAMSGFLVRLAEEFKRLPRELLAVEAPRSRKPSGSAKRPRG
jgi:LysR family hydrogen peroxide-inducible transcriptional activator